MSTRILAPADDPSSPCRWHKSGRDRNQQASKMTWKAVDINVDIIERCCSVWPEKYMNAFQVIFSQSGTQAARNACPVCMALLSEFYYYYLLTTPNRTQTHDSNLNNNTNWMRSSRIKMMASMQHQHHLYHPTLITQRKTATRYFFLG